MPGLACVALLVAMVAVVGADRHDSGPASGDWTASPLGCFKDRALEGRAFPSSGVLAPVTTSVGDCMALALARGYTLFGLQQQQQQQQQHAAVECWFGNDLLSEVARNGPSNDCTQRCPGKGDELCGGQWALSVYRALDVGRTEGSGGGPSSAAATAAAAAAGQRIDGPSTTWLRQVAPCRSMGFATCEATVRVPLGRTCDEVAEAHNVSLSWLLSINPQDACSRIRSEAVTLCVVPEPVDFQVWLPADGSASQVQPIDMNAVEPGCKEYYVTRFRDEASMCSEIVALRHKELRMPLDWATPGAPEKILAIMASLNNHNGFACPSCGASYPVGTFVCVKKSMAALAFFFEAE